MVYVDSDGVVADFDKWCIEHNNGVFPDKDTLHKLMVNNPNDFYRVFEQIPGSQWYLDNVKKNDDWFILTAIPRFEYLAKYSDEKTAKELQNKFRENKYLWFEEKGIPREKVIILNSKYDKDQYSKPGNTLYDDFAKNIEAWKAKGGTGILVEKKQYGL